MRFRVWFEPMDVKAIDHRQIESIYKRMQTKPDIMKILPIDEDGFPIEQPKQVE